MPIGELEKHPYLDYLMNYKIKESDYDSIIIGSFPVYGCTDTIDESGNVIISRDQEKFRFFYGSKKSKFWDLISKAFSAEVPKNKETAIQLLNNKGILITDVISQTERRDKSAEDNDLILNDSSLNFKLIDTLNKYKNVQNLFFTSSVETGVSPYSLFKSIFNLNSNNESNRIQNGTRLWSLKLKIDTSTYNVFFLPTPKARGIHFTDNNRLLTFCNYIESVDVKFYDEISNTKMEHRTSILNRKLTEFRKEFLVECYKQSLLHKNLTFDGKLIS